MFEQIFFGELLIETSLQNSYLEVHLGHGCGIVWTNYVTKLWTETDVISLASESAKYRYREAVTLQIVLVQSYVVRCFILFPGCFNELFFLMGFRIQTPTNFRI